MKIFPSIPKISPTDGFLAEADIFRYKDFGHNLIKLFDQSEDVFVSVIDGSWGIGKTTFIQMLAGEFRKQEFPTIYFDAFENDYLDDPFIAISSEIIELAQEKKLAQKPQYKKFLQSAGKTAIQVGKVAMKVGAKGLTLGVLDNDKLDDFDNIAADLGEISKEAVEKSVEELLKSRKDQKNNIEQFQDSLADLVKLLSGDSDKPLIFIIDELDRCRPDFALGLLERIKHFYRIDKVYFVLVANLEQLSHSVCARYGDGIDGENYLHKFYDLRFELIPKTHSGRQEIYWDSLSKESKIPSSGRINEIIKSWCSYQDISLRELQKIYVIRQLVGINWDDDFISEIISLLCISAVIFPSLFSKILNENASFEETKLILEIDEWYKFGAKGRKKDLVRDVSRSWQYLLDKDFVMPTSTQHLDIYNNINGIYRDLKDVFQLVS